MRHFDKSESSPSRTTTARTSASTTRKFRRLLSPLSPNAAQHKHKSVAGQRWDRSDEPIADSAALFLLRGDHRRDVLPESPAECMLAPVGSKVGCAQLVYLWIFGCKLLLVSSYLIS